MIDEEVLARLSETDLLAPGTDLPAKVSSREAVRSEIDRRIVMQTTERTRERSDRRSTGWLIAAVTFAAVIIVIGVTAFGLFGSNDGDVVATTAAPTPTTTPTTAPPALEVEGTYAGNVQYWLDDKVISSSPGVPPHIEIPSVVWLDMSTGDNGPTSELVIADGIRLAADGSFRMGQNNALMEGPEGLTRFTGVEVADVGGQLTVTWDQAMGSVEDTDNLCITHIDLTFDIDGEGDTLTLSDGSFTLDQQCEDVRPGPVELIRGSLTKNAAPMPSAR